jgi:hypothetical protein
MNEPIYIVEEIASIVSKTATLYNSPIYYMYGHPLEIVNRLQELSKSPKHKDQKYPLIALFTDIPIKVTTPGMYGEAELQLIIATLSNKDFNAEQRLQNTFKPVLYPIKKIFLEQMKLHRQFTYNQEMIHISTDRFYWGKQGLYGNTGNIFDDYIDAIEISNLKVFIKNKNC